MDSDHLKTLKYTELQKLAKKNGVKANLKADKIIVALLDKLATADGSSKPNLAEEKTTKIVEAKERKSRKRGRNEEIVQVPAKTFVKEIFTPVQKQTPKVRLVTPSSFMTPKTGDNITPSSRVVNMPKTATPHPRKSTGARTSIVKANTPNIAKAVSGAKSRRTSPRIAAQEIAKQSQDEQEAKKVRRSTFEVQKDGVTEVKTCEPTKVKQPANNSSCNIPRFSAFLASKKKTTNSGTKDWSKMHQKQFDKMESIDDYLARKRKRTDELSSSVKKAKTLTERTKNAVNSLKAYRTPPASANKKPRKSVAPPPLFQSPKLFIPKVTSTKKMNVQFDKTKPTGVFVFKGNAARKSVVSSARKSVGAGDARKSLNSGVTPFKLKGTGNTTATPGPVSAKKATFDLKASLAKPLGYKPYKGKLTDHNKINLAKAKENVKKPKVTTMAERRALAVKQRGQRKTNAVNARRGIKA